MQPISLTLNGIGKDGIGTGTIDYGNSVSVDILYEATTNGIVLYYGESDLGELTYSTSDYTLRGNLYSLRTEATVSAVFCLYDDFKGVWVSSNDGMEIADFNGFGTYTLAGSSTTVAVSGTVRITDSTGKTTRVSYRLENGVMAGTFTLNGVSYSLSYDALAGTVTVSSNGQTVEFSRRDSLYGYDLVDANGAVYNFDGRGELATGGTLTVTDSTNKTTYIYKLNGDTIALSKTGEATVGSITVANNVYQFVFGSTEAALTVKNDFSGTWYVGELDGERLVINSIGADNTATGSYRNIATTFTLDRSTGVLTFTVNGVDYSAEAKSGELLVTDSLGGSRVCIPSNRLDSNLGTYEGVSDKSTLFLDGLGNSLIGQGYALLTESDGTKTEMTYNLASYGSTVVPTLLTSSRTRYLLVAVTDKDDPIAQRTNTVGVFTKGNATYALCKADAFYGRKGTDDDGIVYTFDGIGGLWAMTNSTYKYYSYNYLGYESSLGTYRFELEDEEGNGYIVRYDNYGKTFTYLED
jgi:hypothetical protein